MTILAKWAVSELKLNWTEQFETTLFNDFIPFSREWLDINDTKQLMAIKLNINDGHKHDVFFDTIV